MGRFFDRVKRLFQIELPEKEASSRYGPVTVTRLLRSREGTSKIHLRQLPDGSSIMVVDGHFLVTLNATSHLIMKMKLDGKTDDAIMSLLSRRFPGASSSSIKEDIEQAGGLLMRLKEEGGRGFPGNLFTSPLNLEHPFRADIRIGGLGNGQVLDRTDGFRFLERLHERGVISVRLISSGSLSSTPVVDLVEKTQDMGIIAGLMVKGRELVEKNLLWDLLQAGIDYFEVPVFSNIQGEHELIEGTGSYEADLEGIRMLRSAPDEVQILIDFPILRINIDNIEPTLILLARYGIENVNVSSVIVPEGMRKEDGLGITLLEYEHAITVVEEASGAIGLGYVLGSPIWYRKSNPGILEGWAWKCTASENSPLVTPDGDVFPCLHSRNKLGSLKEGELRDFPLPLQVLTDSPLDEVDYVTICNQCREIW